mmetsp:Transcript_40699/g.117776  ORF Transcript_40699/g.117776 Transcript_40699/m.117776 type:complete len:231 (+) Transcript_40699:13-705(+)
MQEGVTCTSLSWLHGHRFLPPPAARELELHRGSGESGAPPSGVQRGLREVGHAWVHDRAVSEGSDQRIEALGRSAPLNQQARRVLRAAWGAHLEAMELPHEVDREADGDQVDESVGKRLAREHVRRHMDEVVLPGEAAAVNELLDILPHECRGQVPDHDGGPGLGLLRIAVVRGGVGAARPCVGLALLREERAVGRRSCRAWLGCFVLRLRGRGGRRRSRGRREPRRGER